MSVMCDSWQAKLDQSVDRLYDEIVAVRRHMHAHPEPSEHEHETSLYLYQRLSDAGFEVEMGPEGRGVTAGPQGKAAQARVALRADIDALRIHEQNDVAYCSQRPGFMHACGHDAHTATVLGAVLALDSMAAAGELPWPVDWRAIFQPAEETSTGARQMIAAGALNGIEAIFAVHVDPTRPVGTIGVRPGILTAHCDAMRLTITGRGGHAARPHESNDPIAAAAQMISTLYLFVPRANDSQDAVVLTIGQMSGGENPNVIPEQVTLGGTLRTLDRSVRERTIAHIRQLARGIAESSSTQIDVAFEAGVHGVDNDPKLTALVSRVAADVLGEEHVQAIPRPSMGSEDFAWYLEHVPGVMFRLGCASASVGSSGLHTPTFDVDEQALALGAKILARTVITWSAPAGA